MKRIALVSGASSGMGRLFALELLKNSEEAKQHDEIWLLARREKELKSLEEEMAILSSRHTSRSFVMDLTKPACSLMLEEALKQKKQEEGALRISLLINNAGFGTYGSFIQTPLDPQLAMLDLNIRALTELCWTCIPWMAPGSRILNVASLAAMQPLGNFAVYAASKAYVLSFSTALAAELEGFGISVCSLNPGSVQSEFAKVASGGARAEVLHGYPALPVVQKALKASRRKKWFSMPRFSWKLKTLAGLLAGSKNSARFSFKTMPRPRADALDRYPGMYE